MTLYFWATIQTELVELSGDAICTMTLYFWATIQTLENQVECRLHVGTMTLYFWATIQTNVGLSQNVNLGTMILYFWATIQTKADEKMLTLWKYHDIIFLGYHPNTFNDC